ncbi:MAG: dTDP-4-dehydrorhamnose reductase [Gemmatimonadetes bacterium]|nr:dTDP-4-dehydrorhamnose reductase [Gemmatimonadota bacterium]
MKFLLFGQSGQVGWELRRSLQPLGQVVAAEPAEADFKDPDAVRRFALAHQADVIVNAAAYTAVDQAESDEANAHLVNAESVGALARVAAEQGAWLVHYSTDYVFDGSGTEPWRESDPVAPLNAYGRTKAAGESAIKASGCKHLLLRTSWVYAARGNNFVRTILRLAEERDELRVIADQHGVPTAAEFLASETAGALAKAMAGSGAPLSGTYHLAPRGETTWHGIACEVVRLASELGAPLRVHPDRIVPIPSKEYPLPAPRPANSRLCVELFESRFGVRCPDWRAHLQRVVAELVGGLNT